MKPKPKTTREKYLGRAASLTAGSRQEAYGDPTYNMAVQSELQDVIDRHLIHTKKGYKAALNSIAVKLARAICSPEPAADTFIDLAGYAAIAGEILYPRND